MSDGGGQPNRQLCLCNCRECSWLNARDGCLCVRCTEFCWRGSSPDGPTPDMTYCNCSDAGAKLAAGNFESWRLGLGFNRYPEIPVVLDIGHWCIWIERR